MYTSLLKFSSCVASRSNTLAAHATPRHTTCHAILDQQPADVTAKYKEKSVKGARTLGSPAVVEDSVGHVHALALEQNVEHLDHHLSLTRPQQQQRHR